MCTFLHFSSLASPPSFVMQISPSTPFCFFFGPCTENKKCPELPSLSSKQAGVYFPLAITPAKIRRKKEVGNKVDRNPSPFLGGGRLQCLRPLCDACGEGGGGTKSDKDATRRGRRPPPPPAAPNNCRLFLRKKEKITAARHLRGSRRRRRNRMRASAAISLPYMRFFPSEKVMWRII